MVRNKRVNIKNNMTPNIISYDLGRESVQITSW